MNRFIIQTLVDITETKQYRKETGRDTERNQQQNFQTIIQTIGLRTNIIYQFSPIIQILDISNLNFGKQYYGQHRVWTFYFDINYHDDLKTSTHPAGLLIQDLHLVPFIPELHETAYFSIPVFNTSDPFFKNTSIITRF